MLAISRAIEDESLARGDRAVVIGAFQRPLFFDRSRTRWRELSRTAQLAVVFADFERRNLKRVPAEVPLPDHSPLRREWAVIVDGGQMAACVSGWERPSDAGTARTFEALWTVEPRLVRVASHACASMMAEAAPELATSLRVTLANVPAPSPPEIRAATALTNRMVHYLDERARLTTRSEPRTRRA
jgi:DICT domain-containing protein